MKSKRTSSSQDSSKRPVRSQVQKGDSDESLFHSEIELLIEKLAVGGAGLGRHEGQVVFVQDTVPGDRIKAKVIKVEKNFLQAELVEVLQPSEHRVQPRCEIADRCGGCNWQQISRAEQLRSKQLILKETLQKFLPTHKFELLPLKESPREFRYRNRIQPHYADGKIGFFGRKSHSIVAMKDCMICEEPIAEKIPTVASELAQKNSQPMRLELRLDQNQNFSFGQTVDSDFDGFAQVNRFQNQDLVATALSWTASAQAKTVIDLYAGSGNFSFPLAEQFPAARMIAVELNSKLIEKGRHQVASLRRKNFDFILSDVESFLRRFKIEPDSLIVLDPPRGGTSRYIMRSLRYSGVEKIVYISCHPVSLARDLQFFFDSQFHDAPKYKLGRIQGFEMFPQTDHMETIVELLIDRD